MRGDPPRHIRDIAHLYLSRMRVPGGNRVRLVVAGISADVMPGFHAASLALAAAARGIPARVEDRSGLPVNAGCFLGLDAAVWVARDHRSGPSVAAFARVTFARVVDDEAEAGENPRAERHDGVEIVHVPTWDEGPAHSRAVSRAVTGEDPTVILYLAPRDAEPCPWRTAGERPGVLRRVAYVTRAGRGGPGDGCVGTFTRWTRALTDPLPVAMRDPDSRLARQYASALSTLLADAAQPAPAGLPGRVDPSHAVAALEPR